MKKTLCLSMLFLTLVWSGKAQAEAPMNLKLRVEPVANAQELTQLMRQNSVRIALQRHRLWQAAVKHEETRDQQQEKNRHQYRHRNRHRSMAGTMAPQTPKDADRGAAGAAMKQPAPMGVDAPKAAAMTRTRTQTRAAMSTGSGDAKALNLRSMLRKSRVADKDDLERKLRERLREQRRLQEQLRSRGANGGSGMAPRRGGRSGR